MVNEIKVGDYVRINEDFRIVCIGIGKVARISADSKDIYVDMCTNSLPISFKKEQIVKHSPNLIDLIECGDYVNGKEVIMDLQESKQWYKSKDDFITCKDYTFEEKEIKEVVTKEQFEAISYKVERKD